MTRSTKTLAGAARRTLRGTAPRTAARSLCLLLLAVTLTDPSAAQERAIRLDDLSGLTLRKVEVRPMTYQGLDALQVMDRPEARGEDKLVILEGTRFADGTITVRLAGRPREGAGETARGFIGIAVRVGPDAESFECIYLRPTNGRADDQLRRNHTTQYVSYPDYPWDRLRSEAPGVYESYVDLVPGAWTDVRIEVSGRRARLYVHGADQPALIVNDLKLEPREGAIALWVGPGTEGYFTALEVSTEK